MTVKLIPDKGNGATVNASATVKRVAPDILCPLCGRLSFFGASGGGREYRHCQQCEIAWIRGEWHYLVEFTEPEATS